MTRLRIFALSSFLTLAPAAAWAQGLPADDEIVLPGRHEDPPAAAPERPAPARPARSTRAERRRRARRPARARSYERSDDLGERETDDDAEARRLEEEGIEYEVRQQIEWEERRRREEESAAIEEPLPALPPRQAEDDELDHRRPRHRDVDLEPAPVRDEEREDRDRDREREDPDRDRGREERPSRGSPDDLIRLEVGVSATTRQQVIDAADGSTIRFGLTPFASAYGSAVLTPLARLDGGPRGLGLALSYDRAIRMEAVTDDQVLEASADHFAAMALYRFSLPGRVRIEPRLGYDLVRFLLAPNDTLPGIVYESIALGGNAHIPILRDRRTGDDRLRVRFGGAIYFPIGLGEAAAKYGQSGSASGFSFEGGLEGTVSGVFGYFALLRHASYSASFHASGGAAASSAGETTSEDGVTSGLCGGSVRF